MSTPFSHTCNSGITRLTPSPSKEECWEMYYLFCGICFCQWQETVSPDHKHSCLIVHGPVKRYILPFLLVDLDWERGSPPVQSMHHKPSCLQDWLCQGHSTPSVPSAKVTIIGIVNYPHKGVMDILIFRTIFFRLLVFFTFALLTPHFAY